MANLKITNGRTGAFKRQLINSDKVVVGASKYGYGLFCVKPIRKGEIIGEYVIMHNRIPNEMRVMGDYVFRGVQTGYVNDGTNTPLYDKVLPSGDITLVNHSSTHPNIDIEQNHNFERLIYAFAMRDIRPGEEILWDYGYQPK